MKQFVLATLLCAVGGLVHGGADTDGDGLLDLVDWPAFDANASGAVSYFGSGLQDLMARIVSSRDQY